MHMWGNSVGYLNVYVVTNILKPTQDKWYRRIFRDTGNHGDNWIYHELSINSGKDFQVSLFRTDRAIQYKYSCLVCLL